MSGGESYGGYVYRSNAAIPSKSAENYRCYLHEGAGELSSSGGTSGLSQTSDTDSSLVHKVVKSSRWKLWRRCCW
eukprot:825557-Amphidinium_carterae.1